MMKLVRIPRPGGFCSSSGRWLTFKMGFRTMHADLFPERVF